MVDVGSAITGQGPSQPRGDTGVTLKTVKALFIKVRSLPGANNNNDYKVCEMCRSCEQVAGPQTMEGAQRIGGLWRLYPRTTEARTALLVKGIDLRGVHVDVSDTNPFLVGSDGDEVQSTRLIVSDVPLSSSNKDIEDTLLKLGCKLLSPLRYELERDEKGLLTQWKTGRRYVFIAVPASPLQRDIKIGIFNAKLYHREQKSQRPVLSCYNCFERGHVSRECPNLMRCRVCRQEGHKQGDQVCALNMTSQAAATDFPTLTPSAASSTQGHSDQPATQGSMGSAPAVTRGSMDTLPAESPSNNLESDPSPQPSPSPAVLGQSHQQDGSGQEEDCSMSASPSDPKKKKKKKKGDKNILKRLLSPEAPVSKKEKLEVDRDSDSSWSLSYRLLVDWPG